jgi:hypothetical protein
MLGIFFCVIGATVLHEGLYILGQTTMVFGVIVNIIDYRESRRTI